LALRNCDKSSCAGPIVRRMHALRTGACLVRGTKHRSAWNEEARSLGTLCATVLLEVGVEPGEGALYDIALVLGVGEEVAFAFVDDDLSFHAKSL
jgi:hypothetical protein